MGTPFSPIPNFTGSLAGQLFRNAINALFGGTTPTTPQITGGTVDGAVFGSVTPPTGALGQMRGVTPSQGDNSTNLATTAFVAGAAAPLNSPAFTGTPTAPTGAAGNNTQQIATNAFVQTSYASPPAAGLGSTTACPVNATTIAASGLISPSGGIAGRTNGAAPAAGTIGETLSSIITSGSAVSLTSGAAKNVTSVTLTPGYWEISGEVWYGGTATSATYTSCFISTTSATIPSAPGLNESYNVNTLSPKFRASLSYGANIPEHFK